MPSRSDSHPVVSLHNLSGLCHDLIRKICEHRDVVNGFEQCGVCLMEESRPSWSRGNTVERN